ncbi:sialate O-acetylesterase [Bifidobacterium callitrichidarum]|uniref:Sialate O-acetylesterase n=2 Tax=Bifidobacterium callitrichidarum TaxID=2052941 RepID=A0A2U2N9W3_9BIFI|nr:sialate O-acetylesterase [Bifidobacterium callitrichidarum]
MLAACAMAVVTMLFYIPWSQSDMVRTSVPQIKPNSDNIAVTLPNYYTPGMVLQRGKPLAVKGKASEQSSLTIAISDGKRTSSRTVRTARDGSFAAELKALPAQLQPYSLKISSNGRTISHIDKVYVGDVFLAAGQSNMEASYDKYYRDDAYAKANMGSALTRKDLPRTISDTQVHFIVTAARTSNSLVANDMDLPLRNYSSSGWLSATGSDSEYLGYLPQLFAEHLREASPNVPIGIIQTAWGGTDIQPHMQDGAIFEHHIKPLTGLHIGGILWYQGEDDAQTNDRALAYLSRFTALITQYRAVFDEKDLPFLYVQLARNGGAPYTPVVRQAQSDALIMAETTKNLAMTVSIDTDKGTSEVIHPLGKDILAARMAEQWQAMQQGEATPESPIAIKAAAKNDDKSRIVVSFTGDTGKGLIAMNPNFSKDANSDSVASMTKDSLQGFEAAGSDGKFVKAKAVINPDEQSLTISAEGIDDIRQVRYQWTGVPSEKPFLYNNLGLPASPFTLSVERHLLGPNDD